MNRQQTGKRSAQHDERRTEDAPAAVAPGAEFGTQLSGAPLGTQSLDAQLGAQLLDAQLGAQLLDACADLDARRIHGLLERIAVLAEPGAALEETDERGRTPLGVAAAAGDSRMVRQLLDAGADANAATPAAPAAGLGSPEARRVAAREGVDLCTPLTCAVESGELEVVEVLLASGASPYGGGATNPLELAVLLGDEEIVRSLLDAGADPNARDSEGDTPLMIAAAAGLAEPIDALLEYGAIASARNDDGDTALRVAARAGRRGAFDALAPRFTFFERLGARRDLGRSRRGSKRPRATLLARTERFHDDALHGRLAAVRKALAAGVDPDTRWSDDGDTALILAAQGGHVGVVRALLEGGADPNLYAKGDTPLTRALGPRALDPRATHDVVRALVFGGADLEMRDGDGLTPLMRSVVDGRGDLRVVTALVDLGADVEATHPAGVTALDLALHDPSKVALAERLEALIEKRELPDPARVETRQESRNAVEELRGLGDPTSSCVVLAVRASLDRVAPTLELQRGGRQWSRDVYGEDGWFAGEEGYVVYRMRGHAWALAQTALVDERALRTSDAQKLSAELDCDAMLFECCEASGVLRYALYSGGTRVEEFGLREDGCVAFQSSMEAQLDADAAPLAQLQARFEDWELYVPGVADDRLEWLAREFRASDFERVDFLRIDTLRPERDSDFAGEDPGSLLD